MPSTADQQRLSSAIPNPFDEQTPRLSEYTAQEIATLQSRLNKQLGPEYISTRSGPGGGKVAYVTAEKVINLANEVFGFNGWSSSIQNVQIDFVEESQSSGKISLGLSIIMRVSLKNGTYHEDIGYGSIENARGKAAAFEKAKKEAATDALKRALRTFGNLLGNCLYDKDYLSKVGKLKVAPTKWDIEKLHRHPDYAPIKAEPPNDVATSKQQTLARQPINGSTVSIEFEDDLGGSLFDGVEMSEAHGDEVTMHSIAGSEASAIGIKVANQPGQDMPPPNRQHMQRMQSMPLLRSSGAPTTGQNQQLGEDPFGAQKQQARMAAMARRAALQSSNSDAAVQRTELAPKPISSTSRPTPQAPQQVGLPQQDPQVPVNVDANSHVKHAVLGGLNPPQAASKTTTAMSDLSRSSEASDPQLQQTGQGMPQESAVPANLSVGFVSSRAAELLQQPAKEVSNPLPVFNPHAESPSLRRTSGFNHNRSGPISREQLGKPDGPAPPAPPVLGTTNAPNRGNFVDQRMDPNRRIGMPNAAQSPLANRGAYKPPGPAQGIKRPPLADVSNVAAGDGGLGNGDGLDAKKARLAPT